jgi:exonuclease III
MAQEPPPATLAAFAWRYLPVVIPAADLEIVGLYGPLQGDAYGAFWPAALDALEARSSRNVLVIGDFNTAESSVDTPVADFFCSNFFCDLPSRGYTDLWRHRVGREAKEYSWLGPANPFRLDHAFGTRGVVDRLTHCAYSHTERESGISDHSLLTVELATS